MNPSLIIYEESKARRMTLEKLIEIFKERGWTGIDAVKEGRILILEEDTLGTLWTEFHYQLERSR